jgi:hypothetical protein
LQLAAPSQRVVEFVGDVEMVLDDALVAPGDENEFLDPRRARLVDDVLQDRPATKAVPKEMLTVVDRSREVYSASGDRSATPWLADRTNFVKRGRGPARAAMTRWRFW